MNEDSNGNPPTGNTAQLYQQATQVTIPVTADPSNQVYAMTPWTGAGRPGKCALAPDMTILACYIGDDDTQGFDAITAHAGAQ